MPVIAWPDWTRRPHASTEFLNVPSSVGIVRVALLPSWWQAMQPSVLTWSSHCSWVFMSAGMPLPLGPVPGNMLLSGIFSIENQ